MKITRELLIQRGFIYIEGLRIMEHSNTNFIGYFDDNLLLTIETSNGEIYPPCDTIEQLEALFYALTGENL